MGLAIISLAILGGGLVAALTAAVKNENEQPPYVFIGLITALAAIVAGITVIVVTSANS